MTVDNPSVIDLVAHDSLSDVVSLIMVEHRDWGVDGALLSDLQAKLNTYLAYAVNGQFAADYPSHQGKVLRFDLRTAYPLGPREIELLEIVRRRHLSPRGIELSWNQYDIQAGAGGRP